MILIHLLIGTIKIKKYKSTMKAKKYKSITEILEKKYKKKFYLFMDLQDCMNRIKQRKDQ